MDLGNTSVLPIAARKIDGAAVTPAEAVFGRAFNLWMYETVRHPERSSHEADDVAAFRKQSAMGIETALWGQGSGESAALSGAGSGSSLRGPRYESIGLIH